MCVAVRGVQASLSEYEGPRAHPKAIRNSDIDSDIAVKVLVPTAPKNKNQASTTTTKDNLDSKSLTSWARSPDQYDDY